MTGVASGDGRWRKSSRSSGQDTCVELASFGAVRDSKNAAGPRLAADVRALVEAVKADRLRGVDS
ncbi:DUF397 domain-containing protein [Actinophytocola xanthii]|uniref:DUF397 domain-containing protein n=1 Tax=Actinophytocola xanthii TaxID=1912961 RepID=A0A1Q8CSR8_9PSEU|nr:DUF397 domain-containing protein [Actinophytocola xanthii]OLF17411.1 hypothetical protein BU204_11590 [Actinophytocola xanthii]